MADLAKSRIFLQGALPESWKMREKWHFEKKRKKLGKRFRMYFAVFDGFGPILMVFIDQNMQIHDFLASAGILDWFFMIWEQILFKTCENLNFFQKLFFSEEKIIFLWKIFILRIDVFPNA